MKKIINGKRYDTDKAKSVGSYNNGVPTSDFSYIREELYQKKTGEFFLHGEGGAMTRFAQSCGQNSWMGGQRIMPMTYEEARQWAEEYLEVDEYESIFGEVSEEGGKVITSLSLSQKAHDILKRKSLEAGKSMGEYVEGLLN